MIPMLIEQAINIKMKSDMHPAIISDYELAYALGLACRKLKLQPSTDLKHMREEVIKGFENYNTKSLEDKNLSHMISVYEVENNAPESDKIEELIKMGYDV